MYIVQCTGFKCSKKLQMQLPSVKIWTKSTISSDYSSLMCMFKKRATLVWEAEAVKICLSNNYTLKTLKVFKLSHKSMLHQPPPPLPKPPPPPCPNHPLSQPQSPQTAPTPLSFFTLYWKKNVWVLRPLYVCMDSLPAREIYWRVDPERKKNSSTTLEGVRKWWFSYFVKYRYIAKM